MLIMLEEFPYKHLYAHRLAEPQIQWLAARPAEWINHTRTWLLPLHLKPYANNYTSTTATGPRPNVSTLISSSWLQGGNEGDQY